MPFRLDADIFQPEGRTCLHVLLLEFTIQFLKNLLKRSKPPQLHLLSEQGRCFYVAEIDVSTKKMMTGQFLSQALWNYPPGPRLCCVSPSRPAAEGRILLALFFMSNFFENFAK